MTHRLVRRLDTPATRWRNGGGVTRELLTWPDQDHWQIRVSVADIDADTAFSAYPDVRRWLTVLQGAGMALTIDGVSQQLARGDPPLRFGGAAATNCRLLDGPARALNLMLRGAVGTMCAATDGLPWASGAAQCGLFTAVAGQCVAGELDIAVPPYALLWFDAAPHALTFTAAQRPAALIGWWLSASATGARE